MFSDLTFRKTDIWSAVIKDFFFNTYGAECTFEGLFVVINSYSTQHKQ